MGLSPRLYFRHANWPSAQTKISCGGRSRTRLEGDSVHAGDDLGFLAALLSLVGLLLYMYNHVHVCVRDMVCMHDDEVGEHGT